MHSRLTGTALALGVATLMTWSVGAQQPSAQAGAPTITAQQLVNGLKDPTQWLTYHGDYSGQRHSPLTQITPQNVSQLAAQWTFQTDTLGRFEATPLLIDGVLYFTGPNDTAWAVDARSGRQIWRYRRDVPPGVIACCGFVNTGFAALGDRLFKETLDAHLIALSMKTGAIVWDTVMADYKAGYSGTRAPLAVKDKIVVGIAGGEYGIRPFVDAYDAQTGKRAWRFNITPGPGEPGHETWQGTDEKAWEHGGGATWMTGTYDPEQNLVFWGSGNAGPDYDGREREGDNLYTASLVVLDGDTGKLRWHYQYTPHDVHDADANQVAVLSDLTLGGQPRKVVMVANSNGFFYTLDRVTGRVIVGKPYVYTTWAKEIGRDGRPILLQSPVHSEEGTKSCPANKSTNWQSPSFDPALRLFFVTGSEACSMYYAWKTEYKAGESFRGGAPQRVRDDKENPEYGFLRAIDPTTGERKWEFRFEVPPGNAGIVSTASGVLFTANAQGYVLAFDSKTGTNLWRYQTGSAIGASPITYMLDGRQYVLIPSGTTLTAFALPQGTRP